MSPQLVNAQALAQMLNLRTHRVYELVRRGMIPHIRFGRQVRFDVLRVRAWLDAGGSPPPQEEAC